MFQKIELFLIRRFYQPWLSPYLGRACRFQPTCSHYAVDALEKYGFWKANYYIVYRLLRCQPLCKGGWDPLP